MRSFWQQYEREAPSMTGPFCGMGRSAELVFAVMNRGAARC
jgi:hypothetical protein